MKLQHTNIIKVNGYGQKGFIKKPKSSKIQNDLAYVKMQYIQGGNLLDFIDLLGGRINEEEARFFMLQISSLLQYLH